MMENIMEFVIMILCISHLKHLMYNNIIIEIKKNNKIYVF